MVSIDGIDIQNNGVIDPNKLPFSQNKLAQYLENQPLGESI